MKAAERARVYRAKGAEPMKIEVNGDELRTLLSGLRRLRSYETTKMKRIRRRIQQGAKERPGAVSCQAMWLADIEVLLARLRGIVEAEHA